jgi:hypothetical protein
MKEKIINMIDSVGVFETAKYFGGVQELVNLSKTQSGLYNLVMSHLGGSWTLQSNKHSEVLFDFTTINYDFVDEDIIDIIVDLKVDFGGLINDQRKDIILWLLTEANEFEGIIELNDDTLNDVAHKGLSITHVNGGRLPRWFYEQVSDNNHNIISSKEGFDLYWSK